TGRGCARGTRPPYLQPPFAAAAVNHRVPDGGYSPAPGDCQASPMERRTVCKQNSSPPCQFVHTALDSCAQHSHAKQCDYSEIQTHDPIVKHTQHTVKPLIGPHVNPFLPSAISTVSVLFF
ncbi:unnamed protein product, partial [Staurois parvus]